MQTAAWVDAAVETWGGPAERVRVEGAGIVLVPGGVGTRDFAGWQVYEPADAVYADVDAVRALAEQLRPRALRLRRLLADSPLVTALPRAVVRPESGAPVVRLDAGWATGEGRVSRSRASDLRRAWRRAEQGGGVAFEVVAPTPGEVDALLARVAAVEDASWKARTGTSLVRDRRRASFYSRYGQRVAADGLLRCAFLTIGGADAAAHLALEWDGAYWLFKIGFDERWSRCSPGQLLMLASIRDAAARGLERYELLGTAAPWTQMWTEEVRRTVTLLTFPASPAGLAAAGADVANRLRRRLR